MALHHTLAQHLNIDHPIIQAPMAGSATTPEFVAAASNAGILGSFGGGYLSAKDIRQNINKIRKLTRRPFAVNLFVPEKHQSSNEKIQHMQQLVYKLCPELTFNTNELSPPFAPDFDQQMQVIVDEKIPVLSFTFGIPSLDWLNKLRKNGTLLIGTATNIQEALLLEENGIDIIVAQGKEAGGHRGTFIGEAEDSLIPVKDLVSQIVRSLKTPIVAAGGIMNAEHIATLFRLSASGVQMGSAFLACSECGITSKYKEKLLNANSDCTVLTRAFSGKLARGLDNAFIKRMQPYTTEILPYPIQHAITRPMRGVAEQQNNTDFMSMWAGQHAHLAKKLSVEKFINILIKEIQYYPVLK